MKQAQNNTQSGEVHYLDDSERALLALVKQKDQRAFRQLYDKHVGRVYALCLRLTGNAASAEEASQEVFIQVWRKIDSFSGSSAFSSWLHSVASNTTISYMRKQKGWLRNIISKDSDEVRPDEEKYVPGVDLSRLDRLILKLPERARMIFVLHAIEGKRHEDVAKQLNISSGNSKAQFHRAKTLIKGWLEE
jgi:RNA polymerase sigma-70 factor, ECF subfamily